MLDISVELENQMQKVAALREIYAYLSEGGIAHEMTDVAMLFREHAAELSPWWTGTLSRSHTIRVDVSGSLVEGVVFIDPSFTNPITGDPPTSYGPVVHQDQPWLLWTIEDVGETYMGTFIDNVEARLAGIWGMY